MCEQFELFEVPPEPNERAVSVFQPRAYAFVFEWSAAHERARGAAHGMSDWVRSQLRAFGAAPFSNRAGLSRQIAKARSDFEALPATFRQEVERFRPLAREEIRKRLQRMMP